MKRFAFALCALVVIGMMAISAPAQKMSVASFEYDEMDQTAMLDPTLMLDFNGEKCALIKIETVERNFQFNVGSLGVVDTKWQCSDHPSEIWLYVPHGVKAITIQHPQLGIIKDYDLGMTVKKGRTYVMKLTTDKVNTLIVDYSNNQWVDFVIDPPYSQFYINGIKQELSEEGKFSTQLPFGTHSLRVTAPDYHTEELQLLVDDKDHRLSKKIILNQAFGYLDIVPTRESEGGELYIDDVRVGSLPITQHHVASGPHKIMVRNKLWTPYEEKIQVTDSVTVKVIPVMTPNYADCEITLGGDKESSIYLDGELLDKGQWKGKIEAGNHTLEARKPSHTVVTQDIKVENGTPRSFVLARPEPIYGTLEITTAPGGATVYIDGEKKGTTGYTDPHVLIGVHHVKIQKTGHKDEEFDINIKEGETERRKFTLIDYCSATLSSVPTASVYIDGTYAGGTPVKLNRQAGEYSIKLEHRGYTPWTKKMRLDGNTKNFSVTLHRDLARKNEFYLQAGAEVGGMTGINVGIGMYVYNVNLEANFVMGLSGSETIFWNSPNSSSLPYAANYKPMGWNVKAGYGIKLFSRMRITPQVGMKGVILSEKGDYSTIYSLVGDTESSDYIPVGDVAGPLADSSKAVSMTFGARLNFAILPCLGISVTPEYALNVAKSDGYRTLSDVSKKIKGFSEGFGCNISLYLFF